MSDKRRLLEAAQAGDEEAFAGLVGPYQPELRAHCYRMLGSVADAEDALQETLLRAWSALERFQSRSSLGSWLYRIATNASLRMIEKRPKRVLPIDYGPAADPHAALGEPLTDSVWLEPYPDAELGLEAALLGPDARYEQRESIELAFAAAFQHLPARQRAVLILRDVLGFSAKETAEALETTSVSVDSALQRAHKAIEERVPAETQQITLRALGDRKLREIVTRFTDAWERKDVDAVVAMLADDARLAMPPGPSGTAAVTPWRPSSAAGRSPCTNDGGYSRRAPTLNPPSPATCGTSTPAGSHPRRSWCSPSAPPASRRSPPSAPRALSALRPVRATTSVNEVRVRSELAALDASIEGEVIYPESPEYESVRRPAWAQYENVRPVAVVRCRTPTDVAGSLAVARRLGSEVAPRGGGHCFAGRSATGGLVIDLSPMSSVAEADGIATVGAGARLGEVDERLAKDAARDPGRLLPRRRNRRAHARRRARHPRPHLRARLAGPIVQAQVVLADGRVVECDERREEGLFWALRGAGAGQFGVVTSFSFRAVPAPDLTCFPARLAAGQGRRPARGLAAVGTLCPRRARRQPAPECPCRSQRPPTADVVRLEPRREGRDRAHSRGAGRRRTGRSDLHDGRVPAVHAGQALSLGARARRRAAWRGSGRRRAAPRPRLRQIGVLGAEGFPGSRSMRFVDHLGARRALGQARELDFTPWGGAYARLDPEATAFPHRRERFLPQARGQHRQRRLDGAARRRPRMAHAIEGARPSLGLRRRVSQLRRPRTERPCDRVLRRESQPPGAYQGGIQRRQSLFHSPAHG